FDMNAVCSGFVYALVTATQFVLSGACKNVLVIGAEVFTRILDWQDRTTCVLFGDGAGAVLLQPTDPRGYSPQCSAPTAAAPATCWCLAAAAAIRPAIRRLPPASTISG